MIHQFKFTLILTMVIFLSNFTKNYGKTLSAPATYYLDSEMGNDQKNGQSPHSNRDTGLPIPARNAIGFKFFQVRIIQFIKANVFFAKEPLQRIQSIFFHFRCSGFIRCQKISNQIFVETRIG